MSHSQSHFENVGSVNVRMAVAPESCVRPGPRGPVPFHGAVGPGMFSETIPGPAAAVPPFPPNQRAPRNPPGH